MANPGGAAKPPPPPPPAGAGQPDVDMQSVEGIPKDTLVALLKRKDKEGKALSTKLEKLEERYVKVVRFNKILMEDRGSFLRFCNELLPESEALFEEAAAQEVPVNVEALLRRLAAWRNAFEGAREDRRVFQAFVELVFPGDGALAQLFDSPALGPDAFDALQQRWVGLEDLHNQSIASINNMARDQVLAKAREIEALSAARREAEQRSEDLREQLTKLAKDQAQMLSRRLQGGAAADAAATGAAAGAPASSCDDAAALQQQLRDAKAQAERQKASSQAALEALECRERETRDALDSTRGEVRRLQADMARLREEAERQRTQSRELVSQKDELTRHLQDRLHDLEKEHGSNAFIERMAQQQAGREAELKAQQRKVEHMGQSMSECQRLLQMSYTQDRALKDRIRELEQSQARGPVAQNDYLKHVMLKYVEYTQRGDLKARALVPVLCTLLSLSAEERKTVEQPAVPMPFLYLNQAVGEASVWFRGEDKKASESAAETSHMPSFDVGAGGLNGADTTS